MDESCAWFEARSFFVGVDASGRSIHERSFAMGVPGPVSLVTYCLPLPTDSEVDHDSIEQALKQARSAALSMLPLDPLKASNFVCCASGSALSAASESGPVVGICEAYATQGALPFPTGRKPASNAILGPGSLHVPCTASAPGTAVLGAVLRQVDTAAAYVRDDIESFTEASLAFPPLIGDDLTPALNDSMPGWAAGEDGVGEVAGVVLPWEIQRQSSGAQEDCMVTVQLPEIGVYALRVIVAPAAVVAAALAEAEASDAVGQLSQVLLDCSTGVFAVDQPYVGASPVLYSLPDESWAGWDHFSFAGALQGGEDLQHTAGDTILPSVQSAKAAAGGDWQHVAVHDVWAGAAGVPLPASGAGTTVGEGDSEAGGGWEAPLPSGPFSSLQVLDVASAIPDGHRAQYALADRESLVALAAEHGIESLPHSGPEMYGLFPGVYLALGAVGERHMQPPFTELRLVSAASGAELSSQVGELSASGENWELVFGDIADLVAARAGDDAGIVVHRTVPEFVALVGRRDAEGTEPLVDAALTMSPQAAVAPQGYMDHVVHLQCFDEAGEHIQVAVTLASSASAGAAAAEAQQAVHARTTALSGAGHSLDAEFSADGMPDVGVEGGVPSGYASGEAEEEPGAAPGAMQPSMSSELQEQQDLELAAFMQEEYDMLNAQCTGEEQMLEQLTERNLLLQRRLAAYFNIRQSGDDSHGRPDASEELGVQQSAAQSQEAAQRYRETLEALAAKRSEFADSRDRQQQESLALQKRIEMRKSEAIQISDSLAQWKRTVAQGAVNSITGRPMAKSDIAQFQDEESVRDADIERARVKNIKLKASLEEFTGQLAAKEHLADGLALIDFEQLKIENSTLNEKIEDRNEELHKLRKKTTTTVQVLTHVKEKLQFVAGEAAELKQQLQQLELQVAERRDRMATLKVARESQRSSIEAKKTEQGFAHNDMLAKDFERRKRSMRQLRIQLDELKQGHAQMTQIVAVAKSQGLLDTILR